jgi:hypothetical protein
MGKGFGSIPPKKPKFKPILSTLSSEDTLRIVEKMSEFLEAEDNAGVLANIALRRYFNGEGKGTVVVAPWQDQNPDIIPAHYMVEQDLRDAGLAFQTALDSLERYKPHSEFLFIYWEREQPKIMAACQVISLRSPKIKRFHQ